jgi:site-specific DNA-cytosine methylase
MTEVAKQIGNAVPPTLASAIAKNVAHSLDRAFVGELQPETALAA